MVALAGGHPFRVGLPRGKLRAAHLGAHIEVTALLTPEQVTAYDRLRGYTKS